MEDIFNDFCLNLPYFHKLQNSEKMSSWPKSQNVLH